MGYLGRALQITLLVRFTSLVAPLPFPPLAAP